MKTLLCLLLCIAAPAALVINAAEKNHLSDEEVSVGWKLLFDGRTLSGWRSLSGAEPGTGWVAMEGEIRRVAPSGDLLTEEEFGDFDLKLEWKIETAGNSGIIYRVGRGEKVSYQTGPEYQLLDNQAAHDNKDPKHLAGALYDMVAPAKDVTRPVGTWNEARIVLRGWHVEHWLNGEKLVDVDLSSPEGKALIQGSKFKDMKTFATLFRGHIALQDHDGTISFRNVIIRIP